MDMHIKIGGPIIDTLTVRFWLDSPGPNYKGPTPIKTFCAQIGEDICVGVGGFGPTPLAALRDLCDNIARDEGHKTDNGKLLLR